MSALLGVGREKGMSIEGRAGAFPANNAMLFSRGLETPPGYRETFRATGTREWKSLNPHSRLSISPVPFITGQPARDLVPRPLNPPINVRPPSRGLFAFDKVDTAHSPSAAISSPSNNHHRGWDDAFSASSLLIDRR